MLKKVADKQRQEHAAVMQSGRLVARQSMQSDETTLKRIALDTKTVTQSASSPIRTHDHRDQCLVEE